MPFSLRSLEDRAVLTKTTVATYAVNTFIIVFSNQYFIIIKIMAGLPHTKLPNEIHFQN